MPAMPNTHDLNAREQQILRLVVESFVSTAGPVGSRFLAKRYPLGLSAASIRNTMSDLEDQGYLDHPYTSAGRVPTELGYRTFVDALMESMRLPPTEAAILKQKFDAFSQDTEALLGESSKLLGHLSNLLGVVLTPRLSTGTLERLDIVPLSSDRVMFVLSIAGGLVKTVLFEVDATVRRSDLHHIVAVLNERLAGFTLKEIRRTYADRVRDLGDADPTGMVQLVLHASDRLFSEASQKRRVSYSGTQYLVAQPEFRDPDGMRNLIEFIEDEAGLVQVLETGADTTETQQATIAIGQENDAAKAQNYSVVTARYQIGGTVGTVGLIGPTRMDYQRAVALVEGVAALLDDAQASS